MRELLGKTMVSKVICPLIVGGILVGSFPNVLADDSNATVSLNPENNISDKAGEYKIRLSI